MWKDNAIGVFSNDVLDFVELKAQGVGFVGAFASKLDFVPGKDIDTVVPGANVAAIAQGCADANLPVFFMGEIDPWLYNESTWGLYPAPAHDLHISVPKYELNHKKFYRFGGSLEKFLKAYKQHLAQDAGTLNPATLPDTAFIDPYWFSNATKLTLERFGANLGWPVFLRTRNDLLKYGKSATTSMDWLAKGWLAWTAKYYNYPGSLMTVGWDQFLSQFLPPETVNPNTFNLGMDAWWMWEFTGNYALPGTLGKGVRLVLFNGTKERLYSDIGFSEAGDDGGSTGGGTSDNAEVLARLGAIEAKLDQILGARWEGGLKLP